LEHFGERAKQSALLSHLISFIIQI